MTRSATLYCLRTNESVAIFIEPTDGATADQCRAITLASNRDHHLLQSLAGAQIGLLIVILCLVLARTRR